MKGGGIWCSTFGWLFTPTSCKNSRTQNMLAKMGNSDWQYGGKKTKKKRNKATRTHKKNYVKRTRTIQKR